MDSTALIVIDMLNDFTSKKGALYVPGSELLIENINRLQEKFDTVLFMKDSHTENDPEFRRHAKHCISGTWGSQIDSGIVVRDTAVEIEKQALSMFSNRTAYTRLSNDRVSILCLSGVTTEYSILESVLDAMKLGFRVFLVTDAIAGIAESKASIALLRMGKLGVLGISTEDLMQVRDLRIIH